MSCGGCLFSFLWIPLLLVAMGTGSWGLFLVGFGAPICAFAVGRRRRREYCRDIAAALGLTRQPGRFLKPAIYGGTLDGFQVAMTDLHHSRLGSFVRLRVTIDSAGRAAGVIPPALELVNQKASSSLFEREGALTGDPDFDGRVRVRGDEATALAVLSPDARTDFLSLEWVNPLVLAAAGRVTMEIFRTATREEAANQVRFALRLAQRLVLPADGVAAGLAHRAVEDNFPGVRLRAFMVLVAGGQPVKIAEDTASRLLEDPHPELRLRAAMALGAGGFADLARIVRTPAPPGLPAGNDSGWEIPFPGSADVLLEVLLLETAAAHERRRARALVHLATTHPRERVLPLVREALQASGPLHAAALAVGGTLGDVSFETDALAALDLGVPHIGRAAIEALGAIGTAASVPPLRALAKNSGPLDFELRRAVDEAVTKIQSRLPSGAAGQVALAGEKADSAAGRVSIATDGSAGSVALAADELNGSSGRSSEDGSVRPAGSVPAPGRGESARGGTPS